MGRFDTCQIFKLFFVLPFLFGKGQVILPALEQPPTMGAGAASENVMFLMEYWGSLLVPGVADIIVEIILISKKESVEV